MQLLILSVYNEAIKKQYFIIDFDATFVTVESLPALANIALKNNPQKSTILKQIASITEQAMSGKIPFPEGLKKRLQLIAAHKQDIKSLVQYLQEHITPSVVRNKDFFRNYADNIYIISGGFTDFIIPVVKDFGIDASHVLANTFVFDAKGDIAGYDTKNPLANTCGKTEVIKSLNLDGRKMMIGDGYTDYLVKKDSVVDAFYAFIENVNRPEVTDLADDVLFNFDELLYNLNLPRSLSFPKTKIKVLIVGEKNATAKEIFENEEYVLEESTTSLTEKQLLEKIETVTILVVDPRTPVTKAVLEKGKKLLCIGRFGLGTNNIDLQTATEKGIPVFNAPFSNIRSVVEMVLGDIIALSRQLTKQTTDMQKGVWQKPQENLYEIRGKKLGIVGYDAVGSQLSVLAEMLGMEVYFYDKEDRLPLGNAKKAPTLDDLLKTADIISFHLDASTQNEPITEREFYLMKDGVFLINLSRGFVIDEKLLAKNIVSKKVGGAAIDVFTKEPRSTHFASPLQKLPNVILTPHSGGSTVESEKDSGAYVSRRIIQFMNAGNTSMSVNFPHIAVSEAFEHHRVIHIHKNVPEVMSAINTVLQKHKLHVEEQQLKTNGAIGFAVIDIDKLYDENVLEELKNIPGTIKVRVLY